MKKLFLALTVFGILAMSAPVLAQQQINNDGVSGSDLQQQVGTGSVQEQSTSGQQTSSVTDNAGAAVIQNVPNQPLAVSGAPANSITPEEESNMRWIVLSVLVFLALLSPALLYVRNMQKTGELTDDVLVMKAPKKTAKREEAKDKKEPSKEAKSEPTPKKAKPAAKSKAKKSPANKAKRGKKKRK